MRSMFTKFCLLLATTCIWSAAAPPSASFATTSVNCIKGYTALKRKRDVQQAKAKKQKRQVDQVNDEIGSQLFAKAQECAEIARAEAETFLAKPFRTRFSYKKQSFSDVCELVGDGADIACTVQPAYTQCVQKFGYSPKRCRKLNGRTVQPCCHLKR